MDGRYAVPYGRTSIDVLVSRSRMSARALRSSGTLGSSRLCVAFIAPSVCLIACSCFVPMQRTVKGCVPALA